MKAHAILGLLLCGCSTTPGVEWSSDSLAWQPVAQGSTIVEGYSYLQASATESWVGVALPGDGAGYYRIREQVVPEPDRSVVWSAHETGKLIRMTWGDSGQPVGFRLR